MTKNERPTLNDLRTALAASATRLAGLVAPLTSDDLRRSAYPSEWTVADVLSHLGSGGVLTRLRLEGETEVDMAAVWDIWNAKSPEDQAADSLIADQDLLQRLAAFEPSDVDELRFAMGPFDLDLVTFLGMRLNEHVVHTWDVAVALNDESTIPAEAAALVVDTLDMISGFAGRPTGIERSFTVRTSGPSRLLEIFVQPDGVTLSTASDEPSGPPDLELPAEALVRLVYGRLDPDRSHASASVFASAAATEQAAADLDELRKVYPGF